MASINLTETAQFLVLELELEGDETASELENHDVSDLLEDYLCNGWDIEDGHLTDGIVITSPVGYTYWDSNYQVVSTLESLLKGESVHWTRVP
jgi:hypothetical protein